ncbi:MAG TPA: hypothetical protein VGZ47_08370 [Gemmataceae bacterium]|jgi:hypothetical protein|nr:hypothetical protein [Gemmataceae bacterium]
MSQLIGLAILATLTAPAQPPAAGKEVSYFPLQVGNTWHYKIGDKKVSAKVVAHEKIGDLETAKIESSSDGDVVANENIAQTAEGFVRVAFNGQKIDKPALVLKLPPKKGESWEVDTKIGNETVKGKVVAGEEEIEVPAGKYKTVTSTGDYQINGQPAKIKTWFAPNVGPVKQELKLGGVETIFELQKFEPAK